MSDLKASRTSTAIAALVVAAVALAVGYASWRDAQRSRDRFTIAPPIGSAGAPKTSREDLTRRIQQMEARLAERPDDTGAAVLLADALMRQARVAGNAGLANQAEEALSAALREDPADYDANRMLGAVYLSQHRFREAIRAAERAHEMRPFDAWNFGVIGDGHLELGEYREAFEAFQKMNDMRPSAASYARAAYALELQGNLERALEAMTMATGSTSGHDPESQAWHYSQLGDLYLQLGQLTESRRAYARALLIFPGHPFALAGMAQLQVAEGDYRGALASYGEQLESAPTIDLAARIGDLQAALGNPQEAERYYLMAEQIGRETTQSDSTFARFLADHGRKPGEAVKLAEQLADWRRDIFTDDALAWAYFKVGRQTDANAAADRALRTGTRDRRILFHAAAIKAAAGDRAHARALAERAIAGLSRFDPLLAPAAKELVERLNGTAPQVGSAEPTPDSARQSGT